MTISTPQVRISYLTDGITSSFIVPFPFFNPTELTVYLVTSTPPAATLQTGYTVQGGGDAPGSILFAAAPAAGQQVLILRTTNRTQLTQLVANDDMPAAALETSYDRAAAIDAEDLDMISQTLRAPVQDAPINPLPPASVRAGNPLYFDQAGNPTVVPGTLPTIDFASIKSPLLPAADFVQPWGFSAQTTPGGAFVQQSQTIAANVTSQPVMWLEALYDADAAIPVDFVGGYLGSVPAVLYAQHTQNGTSPANTAGTHSIMAYGINNAAGNNDCLAVSGRVVRANVPGGVGDACGVWGSAYALSLQGAGATIAVEAAIYQNVPGMVAADRLDTFWSAGMHVYSASSGSPALAGLALDAEAQTPGFYGFWNAIIIDKNCFGAGSGSNQGYIGINCGSWDGYNQPQYGIKFGECNCHIKGTSQLTVQGDAGFYFDQRTNGTGQSVIFDMDTQPASNVIVRSGGDSPTGANDILQVLGGPRTVNVTTLLTTQQFAIQASTPPASSSAPGVIGQLAWSESFLYVCVAADKWGRVPLQVGGF